MIALAIGATTRPFGDFRYHSPIFATSLRGTCGPYLTTTAPCSRLWTVEIVGTGWS